LYSSIPLEFLPIMKSKCVSDLSRAQHACHCRSSLSRSTWSFRISKNTIRRKVGVYALNASSWITTQSQTPLTSLNKSLNCAYNVTRHATQTHQEQPLLSYSTSVMLHHLFYAGRGLRTQCSFLYSYTVSNSPRTTTTTARICVILSTYALCPILPTQSSSCSSPANRNVQPRTTRSPPLSTTVMLTLTTSYLAVSYIHNTSSCSCDWTSQAKPDTWEPGQSTNAFYFPAQVRIAPPCMHAETSTGISSGGRLNSFARKGAFASVP
jgi:hypothetical protein